MKENNQNSLNNCHFCSVISKSNGEDPIGSADTYEHWLAMEMELPWSEKRLEENPIIAKAIALIHEKIKSGINIRGQLIVPDREYSQPGHTRFFYYHRPANLFANFEKHEFIVPNGNVESFAIALLETIPKSPFQLTDWQKYRQNSSHIRELMVCTDGNVDLACGKFGSPIYQQLRSQYAGKQLRVWRINHFGGHEFAPTLLDWPSGHCWGHLSPEILNLLVYRNSSVKDLRLSYRGWSGLTQFEQIVEREIWIREGWQWLDYHKAGQVIAIDEANEDWAEIRIDFANLDRSIKGAYKATVEVKGFVMTAWDSGKEQTLERVKQYSVSHLLKVI
jgi:hypothetical protein